MGEALPASMHAGLHAPVVVLSQLHLGADERLRAIRFGATAAAESRAALFRDLARIFLPATR